MASKHGRQDVGLQDKIKKVEYQLNLDANAYQNGRKCSGTTEVIKTVVFFFVIKRELYVFLDADHPALIYLWRCFGNFRIHLQTKALKYKICF